MERRQPGPLAVAALIGLPLATLLLHLVFFRGYGYFRDELYYLACADHMAWGYVDHPPLCVALLWLVRHALGDSLFAIRLLPALAGATTVLLAGLLARRLGGSRFAQTLAMLSTLVAPELLAIGSVFSMNALDVLIWTASAYLLVRALDEERPSWWLALGVVLGLGLLNKISVLWLGFGLAAGLLLARRDTLRRRGPWLAGTIAVVLFLPYLGWEMRLGWPTLEFMRNATSEKMAPVTPWAFALTQILNQHPLTFPVWLAGLGYFLFMRPNRAFRPLGIVYVAGFLILVVIGKSRAGYLAPAYPMLYAGGAVAIASFFEARRLRLAPSAIVALLLVGGAITAPLAMPILRVEKYLAYAGALGQKASTEEKKEVAALPQFFADMQGWERWVEGVASAYRALPLDARAKAAIFASNYGEAGAIDLLGRSLGLPRAISGHNNYWLWGPEGYSGEVMLMLVPAAARPRLEQGFESVEQVGTLECGHCMPYENHRPVFLCRGSRLPLEALWPRLKHYD